ncbi:amidohydrolase family protein [Rathayibacter soli]|uniref:amidohydrolase family protein n=1 Tax=Rathayibacter soli TaxID=3144168 RepID=UPI0027E5B0CF|nr:amidohydrolase family protein [Glaciibacter superstes]
MHAPTGSAAALATGDMILLRSCGALYLIRGGVPAVVEGEDVFVSGGRVRAIGRNLRVPEGTWTIEASDWVVIPGLVNTHHHLSQQLTRTEGLDCGLAGWLAKLYPVWSHITAEDAYDGARIGIAELLLSGCTTVGDFTYYFPTGSGDIFEAQVQAAAELGCRFAPVRGGLVELEAATRERIGDCIDSSIEPVDAMLERMESAINRFHDASDASMCRVGLGLTEKTYGLPQVMRDVAELANRHDVTLHTHLHPRPDERERARFAAGLDPVGFLQDTGWWNERLWIAHGTGLTPEELHSASQHGVGLSLSPSSNARFGLPITPGLAADLAGVEISIGVDGAASNDSGHQLAEMRLVFQTQRIRAAQDGLPFQLVTPQRVLSWATVGGARTLGWDGGDIRVGALADIAAFSCRELEYAGASDPIAALLLCASGAMRARLVLVNGAPVVENGALTHADSMDIAERGRSAMERLWQRSAN